MALIALKVGGSRNGTLHVDSIEGLVQNSNDKKWISTAIAAPSVAEPRMESLPVAWLHTQSRFAIEWKNFFSAWINFMTWCNKKPVRIVNFFFDGYPPYLNFICERLNGVPSADYVRTFWRHFKLQQHALPYFPTYLHLCWKHFKTNAMERLKYDGDLRVLKAKQTTLMRLTSRTFDHFVDCQTYSDTMDSMNALLVLLTTPNWRLTSRNHISSGVFVNDDGDLVRVALPTLLCSFDFTFDAVHNVYTAVIPLPSRPVHVIVHAAQDPPDAVFVIGGKSTGCHFASSITPTGRLENILHLQRFADYLIDEKFPKAPLLLKVLKLTKMYTNQLIEGVFCKERHQQMGSATKKQRIDRKVLQDIQFHDGVIARWVEGHRETFTRQLADAIDWKEYDGTTKVHVSNEDAALHEKYLDYKNLKDFPTAKQCIECYKELKATDPKLRGGPVMSANNIYKMNRRRPLPTRKNWKAKVSHWLSMRIEQLSASN